MDRTQIESLIEAASLAPSVDNCQPWRFIIDDESIDIFLDRPRAEFFGDYGYAASYATLGAVLENLTVAASGIGLQLDPRFFPSMDPDHVVSVRFITDTLPPDPMLEQLPLRCTNRRKYRTTPLDEAQRKKLQQAGASVPGVTLHLIEDRADMKRVFRLAAQIDSIIFDHPLLHANLYRWIRWNRDEINATRDGMPVGSLELDPFQQLFFRIISSFGILKFLNLFGMNRLIGLLNSALLLKSSALGLVVTKGTTNEDYLNGGRCMERVWLAAAGQGLSFQPFGGLPFLLTRMLRGGESGFSAKQYQLLQQIYADLGKVVPVRPDNGLIILFRVGIAPVPSERSVRRKLSDIVTFHSVPT